MRGRALSGRPERRGFGDAGTLAQADDSCRGRQPQRRSWGRRPSARSPQCSRERTRPPRRPGPPGPPGVLPAPRDDEEAEPPGTSASTHPMELLALVGMASVRMPAMRALLTLRPVGWNVAGFLLDRGLALARGTTYHLYPIGWIVVGFLAGVLSGMVVQDRSARGCLLSVL